MTSGSSFRRWLRTPGGRLRRRRFAVVIAVGYVLFAATYVPINLFSVGRTAHTLFLPGEEHLPFWPIFEYLYLLTFFVGPLLMVTIRDYERFARFVRALIMSLGVAYTTYLLFPVYFERPHLDVDSLHTWLLSLKYLDKPYNHFPSLHVTLSWLAVYASQVSARGRAGLVVLAIGVSISTVFVKQHYIVDVLAGFVLASAAWHVATRQGLRGGVESTGARPPAPPTDPAPSVRNYPKPGDPLKPARVPRDEGGPIHEAGQDSSSRAGHIGECDPQGVP